MTTQILNGNVFIGNVLLLANNGNISVAGNVDLIYANSNAFGITTSNIGTVNPVYSAGIVPLGNTTLLKTFTVTGTIPIGSPTMSIVLPDGTATQIVGFEGIVSDTTGQYLQYINELPIAAGGVFTVNYLVSSQTILNVGRTNTTFNATYFGIIYYV